MSDHESACARVAAQFTQLWLRLYVGSKLRRDPIYTAACELFRDSDEPILDIGCGLGLLAFYLRERGSQQAILGLDIDLWKTQQGNRIAPRYRDVELRCQDVQKSIPSFSGSVVLFHVLHYLPLTEQTALLSQLATCIAPGGLLVIRDCPREIGPRFWMTWVAEKFAQAVSWNWKSSIHFPSRDRILEAFSQDEFEHASRPLWGKLPFNNQLFVFRRRVSEVVPVAE